MLIGFVLCGTAGEVLATRGELAGVDVQVAAMIHMDVMTTHQTRMTGHYPHHQDMTAIPTVVSLHHQGIPMMPTAEILMSGTHTDGRTLIVGQEIHMRGTHMRHTGGTRTSMPDPVIHMPGIEIHTPGSLVTPTLHHVKGTLMPGHPLPTTTTKLHEDLQLMTPQHRKFDYML